MPIKNKIDGCWNCNVCTVCDHPMIYQTVVPSPSQIDAIVVSSGHHKHTHKHT